MVRAVILASFEDVKRQQTSSSSLNVVWGTPEANYAARFIRHGIELE